MPAGGAARLAHHACPSAALARRSTGSVDRWRSLLASRRQACTLLQCCKLCSWGGPQTRLRTLQPCIPSCDATTLHCARVPAPPLGRLPKHPPSLRLFPALQLLSISSGFLSSLAMDALRGDLSKNEVQRAIELRNIVTSLGPGERRQRCCLPWQGASRASLAV